jgi:hypothetical protein
LHPRRVITKEAREIEIAIWLQALDDGDVFLGHR